MGGGGEGRGGGHGAGLVDGRGHGRGYGRPCSHPQFELLATPDGVRLVGLHIHHEKAVEAVEKGVRVRVGGVELLLEQVTHLCQIERARGGAIVEGGELGGILLLERLRRTRELVVGARHLRQHARVSAAAGFAPKA